MIGLNYVMAGVGVLVVVGFIGMSVMEIRRLNAVNETLTVQLAEETKRADQNANALKDYVERTAANERVAAQVAAERSTLRAQVRTLTERIANAPDAADAPLAPVLLDALAGLRELYDAAHPIRDGVAGNPAGTEDVRRGDAPAGDGDATPAGRVADTRSGGRVGVSAGRGKAGRRSVERAKADDYPHQPTADDGAAKYAQDADVVFNVRVGAGPAAHRTPPLS